MSRQLSLVLDTGVSLGQVGAPLPARARRTDPETSHAAAASMTPMALSKQRSDVLRVIKTLGDTTYGATAWDCARTLGIQQSVAARRCSDLHELGLIEPSGRTRPGSSKRELIVWVTS